MMNSKYNRTYHLPFSLGASSDDKIAKNISSIIKSNIVITEKCDGSNTSLEYNNCYARSHAGPPTHPSFNLLKSLHAARKHLIPTNLQFFGEYCYAQHSIYYDKLPGYFLLFGIRDLDKQIWLSWDDVTMWANTLQVPTVPVLFRGIIDSENKLKSIINEIMQQPSAFGSTKEGVVVRVESQFADNEFKDKIFKFVRKDHIAESTEHWLYKEIVRNQLKQ